MKKSLIALAVAGAFVAPAAMADTSNVNIYGALNYSFDAVNTGLAVGSTSVNTIQSNVSKIGFKGTEDLGDGLSAVWQIEQSITADTGALNTAAARNTFAGLSSASMGTLIAGVHDTPYKLATRGYDLFGDTIADNRSIMGGAGLHDARLGNVIAYISPAMSGFTVAIATAAMAELPVANSTKGDAVSLAAMYSEGPLKGSFSYQSIKVGTAGTGAGAFGTLTTSGAGLMGLAAGAAVVAVGDKTTAWKISGGYTMDAFELGAIYEKLTYTTGGTDVLNEGNWYLAGKYNISSNDAVKLAYTSAGKNNQATAAQVANSDANQFSLGYDHKLSKRTMVYATYSKLTNNTLSRYTFSQSSNATTSAPSTANADPSVISLGFKHSF